MTCLSLDSDKIYLKVSEPKQEISPETTNQHHCGAHGRGEDRDSWQEVTWEQCENKSFMSIYLIVVEIFQTGPQWRTDIVIHRAWLLELRKISSK